MFRPFARLLASSLLSNLRGNERETGSKPRPKRRTTRQVRFEEVESRHLLSVSGMPSASTLDAVPLSAIQAQAAALTPAAWAAAGVNFVTALYEEVLNRAPDTIGLTVYTNQLMNGTLPSTIANAFWESAEHRGVQVDGFYQTFLGRAADTAGRAFWVSSMQSGVSEEAVMASFANSAEFLQKNPLYNSFVSSLYVDILNRPADSVGLSVWITSLGNGSVTTSQAIQAFINSHERHVTLVDTYYVTFLNRAADTAGETAWVSQLDQGTANDQFVAESFLASSEYTTLHPLF